MTSSVFLILVFPTSRAYHNKGEYCGPHTASSVFLILVFPTSRAYHNKGEYCDPHTASSVFLILVFPTSRAYHNKGPSPSVLFITECSMSQNHSNNK